MIIVDRLLEKRAREGRPINVGIVGAGFMAQGVIRQIVSCVPGMRVAGIFARDPLKAQRTAISLGLADSRIVGTANNFEMITADGATAIVADPYLLTGSSSIDVIFEVTGTIEFAADVALAAFANGKHVVAMNAELDGTLGPVLKCYAEKAGVVFTNADGDQPGVTMNLYRFVRGIGIRPLLCGNIKGLHDPYRTPETQRAFAEKWRQNPRMVTSFADGTKISFEQAVIANATGMRVGRRGMHGPTVPSGTPLAEAAKLFDPEMLLASDSGLVDYIVGAEPAPGVFILGTNEDAFQAHYLQVYKLGDGPIYLFYVPYHLCHMEVPSSIARAVLLNDPTLEPGPIPRVDVVSAAKRDLAVGETLDGIGGFDCYGLAENADITIEQTLLPMGLSEGARLVRPVAKDTVLTRADVVLPKDRLCDRLRAEQDAILRRESGLSDQARDAAEVAAAATATARFMESPPSPQKASARG